MKNIIIAKMKAALATTEFTAWEVNAIWDELAYFKDDREYAASDFLSGSFPWAESPEGFDFWNDIDNRLVDEGL